MKNQKKEEEEGRKVHSSEVVIKDLDCLDVLHR